MSISASHWANIVARVTAHAKALHPYNQQKQQDLVDDLLAINTTRSLAKKSAAADQAMERLADSVERSPDAGTRSWLRRIFHRK